MTGSGSSAESQSRRERTAGVAPETSRMERREVVDAAERHQGADDVRHRHVGRQPGEQVEDAGLEHAEAAGHLAGDPDQLRQQEDREQEREAEAAVLRQQRVERGGRQPPVEAGESDLAERQAQSRQRQLDAAEHQRLAAPRGERHVDQAEGQEQGAERAGGGEVEDEAARQRQRLDQEDDAAQRDEAQPEGDEAEHHHPRHLGGGQPPAGVEAGADRRAGEQREAEAVAERVAGERRQRDLAVGQRIADVAEGQRVVAGHGRITQGGEEHGEQHAAARQRPQEHHHVAVMEPGELAVEQPESAGEQQHGEEGRRLAQQVPGHHRPPPGAGGRNLPRGDLRRLQRLRGLRHLGRHVAHSGALRVLRHRGDTTSPSTTACTFKARGQAGGGSGHAG